MLSHYFRKSSWILNFEYPVRFQLKITDILRFFFSILSVDLLSFLILCAEEIVFWFCCGKRRRKCVMRGEGTVPRPHLLRRYGESRLTIHSKAHCSVHISITLTWPSFPSYILLVFLPAVKMLTETNFMGFLLPWMDRSLIGTLKHSS